MKRWRGLLILVLAAVALAAGGQYHKINGSTNATMSVTSAGDTAQVYKLNKFSALDSFTYAGDIEGYGAGAYPGLGAIDSAYTYTTGPQLARLVITSPVDTSAVYYCSVDYGTNEYGFTFDATALTGAGDTAIASFIDSLVDSINAVADMSDTLTAEDSTALGWILIRSIYPQDELDGGVASVRWSVRVGADDAGTELALGDSNYTTMKMVCDSVAAAINALDSINLRLTAANDNDSVITLTAGDERIAFLVDVADSSMDTATITTNKASKSIDTVDINIGRTYGFNSIQAKFWVSEEQHTYTGLGNSDSVWMILNGILGGDIYEIARDSANALPCSLITYLADDIGDTLLKPELMLRIKWTDTVTDSTFDVGYPVRWEIDLK